MIQQLAASEISLADLEEQFSLQQSFDPAFFTEFKEELPPLSELEVVALQRVKQNFLDQLRSRLLIEETVKLVVVSPLLDLAGFYRSPYRIESEFPIRLEIPDSDGGLIQGRIDTLVVRRLLRKLPHESLWVALVESKRTQFSVHAGVAQTLAYLLARPEREQPGYGLVTNGSEFLFVKQLGDKYGLANLLTIVNENNQLEQVLQLLRRLG